MPDVVAGSAVLAGAAVTVLGEQRVPTEVADCCRGVERLGPCVAGKEGHALAVTLRQLGAERVVVPCVAVVHQLDASEVREGRTLRNRAAIYPRIDRNRFVDG